MELATFMVFNAVRQGKQNLPPLKRSWFGYDGEESWVLVS
jgi:hypothetical protein